MKPAESLSAVRGAIRATAVPRSSAPPPPEVVVTTPAVTLSRQAGIDAGPVARRVAALLSGAPAREPRAWTVYDRQLIDRVVREHCLDERLVETHDEHDDSVLELALHGLGGGESPEAVALGVARTIRRLAEEGRAIIVGRGAQAILADRPHVRHVRLIASEDWRVRAYAEVAEVDEPVARKAIRQLDGDRARYVRAHYQHDPADPQLYDLVLNVARLGVEPAARAIASIVVTDG